MAILHFTISNLTPHMIILRSPLPHYSQMLPQKNSSLVNHQLNQIIPVGFKFRDEYLYDRNIWRHVTQMNRFDPQTQWKGIIDLQITELYDQLPVNNHVLEYLCLKNHRFLLSLLIKNDIHKTLNLNWGLEGACQGGFKDLVQWMIDLGANYWEWGLWGSVQGGFKELAQMMIDHGASHWDAGLRAACEGGHREMVRMMIDLGANDWNWGLQGACKGGFKDLSQMMIDHGATDFNLGLLNACWGGQRDLAQWMVDLGATNASIFNDYFPLYK